MRIKSSVQTGDTIVEVILAMSLLTLILFTSWSAVSRATQISSNARIRIDMVNQLKEQAEVIKAKRSSAGQDSTNFTALFNDVSITDTGNISSNPCDDITDTNGGFKSIPDGAGSFYFKKDAANNVSLQPSAVKEPNDSSRVWIQRKSGRDSATGITLYYDFYIRGCWLTSGGTQKLDNSQLLVRINV